MLLICGESIMFLMYCVIYMYKTILYSDRTFNTRAEQPLYEL
jgi:hypothetical protein